MKKYALDQKTGKVAWKFQSEGEKSYGVWDHNLYALNAETGAIVWKIHVPMRVYGSAIEHNGTIYFGCFDGTVFGVDPASGESRWKFQTASNSKYYEVFDESGGFNKDFQLYGADYLESERKIHELGSVLSSPVIRENMIYFGSSDGNVYAVMLE